MRDGNVAADAEAPREPFDDRLAEYYETDRSVRLLQPTEFVAVLRRRPQLQRIATAGRFPTRAIVMYDGHPERYLERLGFGANDYTAVDVSVFAHQVWYLVQRRADGIDFLLAAGLPGAGGITYQAGELYGLGVEALVHLGLCGLFGELAAGTVVVSRGSYRDAAGVMLAPAPAPASRIAIPDAALRRALELALDRAGVTWTAATGYTIPILFYQPAALIQKIAGLSPLPAGDAIGYVEMEEGALFTLAAVMGKAAASLVVGSDRYQLHEGKLVHEFFDVDVEQVKLKMLQAAISAFAAQP